MENTVPRLLDCGDYLLLPVTPAFSLVSQPGVRCRPGFPSETGVRHGDPEGELDFRMLGGAFRIEPVNAALLLGLLPELIHLRSVEGDTSRLARIIDLIKDECADERQGRTMILERLLEVMLIESLRWRATSQESSRRPVGRDARSGHS
jgi:Cupin